MNRLLFLVLCGCLFLAPGLHADISKFQSPKPEYETLTVLSSTDKNVIVDLIIDFQVLYPHITVIYDERNSLPLYSHFIDSFEKGNTADLLISSAMDLQVKLVNDGYAKSLQVDDLSWMPDWANWRDQAFSLTAEPVVIVYNNQQLSKNVVIKNRFDLLNLLRESPDLLDGKVGTYNIARSGLGYLLASQDARQASTWGRLIESMSRVHVRHFDQTSLMLKALASGELTIAYNLLGSYAQGWLGRYPQLSIVLPEDYTLLMSRVAFVSKHAANYKAGELFLHYLLSYRGQLLLANSAKLYPIHPSVTENTSYTALQESIKGPLKTIKLGPGLLTYLDSLKKKRFLRDWDAVINPQRVLR